MKVLFILFITFSFGVFAQDLSIPDGIKAELQTKQYIMDNDTFNFQVVYPKDFDARKKYPIYLALSGGNQSLPLVNYCYAAWFKSSYFNNYITVLPVAKMGQNLKDYSHEDIIKIFDVIKKNLEATPHNWILGGTSNGGVAAFNFLSASPNLFEGIIIMPGIISDNVNVSREWSHLKVLIAYGSKDTKEWKKGVKSASKILKKKVRSLEFFEMENQGHILPLSYDIDLVYKQYFN